LASWGLKISLYSLLKGTSKELFMTNPLILIKQLDAPPTPRTKREKLKPRRQRRAEARAAKSAK
jgi:hypothetical protein